jgi:hypothetical protein
MSDAYSGGSESGANRSETRTADPLGVADWLCLAAAPIFALMALLTGALYGWVGSIPARRNGPDVRVDEHLPFGALAEAILSTM